MAPKFDMEYVEYLFQNQWTNDNNYKSDIEDLEAYSSKLIHEAEMSENEERYQYLMRLQERISYFMYYIDRYEFGSSL